MRVCKILSRVIILIYRHPRSTGRDQAPRYNYPKSALIFCFVPLENHSPIFWHISCKRYSGYLKAPRLCQTQEIRTNRKAVSDMKNRIENRIFSGVRLLSLYLCICTPGVGSQQLLTVEAPLPSVRAETASDSLALKAHANILEMINHEGVRTPVDSTNYMTSNNSKEMRFVLSAEGSQNPNLQGVSIQYFWELVGGDGMTIALSSGSGPRVTALVSGISPCVQADYIVRVTAIDSTGMREADSANIHLSVTPGFQEITQMACTGRAKNPNSNLPAVKSNEPIFLTIK